MSKPIAPRPPPQTHFEQIPVEIVKGIIDKSAPKAPDAAPSGPPGIAGPEI